MSDAPPASAPRPLVGELALALQDLRTGVGFDQLVRLDHRAEDAAAPFQFDAARGLLHRVGCPAIPADAPLYARTRVEPREAKLACARCMPMPETPPTAPEGDATDLLYGVLSLVDQFASVLRERGRDYSKTPKGQRLGAQIGRAYACLGDRERRALDALVTLLDEATSRLNALDEELRTSHPDRRE